LFDINSILHHEGCGLMGRVSDPRKTDHGFLCIALTCTSIDSNCIRLDV